MSGYLVSTAPKLPNATTTPVTLTTSTTSVHIMVTTSAPLPPPVTITAEQPLGNLRGLMVAIWHFVLKTCGYPVTVDAEANTTPPPQAPKKPESIKKGRPGRSATSYSLTTVVKAERRCAGRFFYFNRGSRSRLMIYCRTARVNIVKEKCDEGDRLGYRCRYCWKMI